MAESRKFEALVAEGDFSTEIARDQQVMATRRSDSIGNSLNLASIKVLRSNGRNHRTLMTFATNRPN